MSTELKIDIPSIGMTRFWGADSHGTCVQVTQSNSRLEQDSILNYHALQLTREDAGILGQALLDFSNDKETESFGTDVLENWVDRSIRTPLHRIPTFK
tara:strand:- start:644 stop:937 length:294 start_codon:yes stop_codon:yes gene_type:complete